MTVPPPPAVPGELIERVAQVLFDIFGSRSGSDVPRAGHRLHARQILAALNIGDIVEAARRDAREEIAVLQATLESLGKSYDETQAERDAALAEVARLREQLTLSRLAQLAPMGDNHHNAVVCPYCSPDRDRIVEAARRDALTADVEFAQCYAEQPHGPHVFVPVTSVLVCPGWHEAPTTEGPPPMRWISDDDLRSAP